ncbi:hypothetical protein PILCRDRAFT_1399 [Piloderma croceum F 1598]|uniref:Tom7-domain-containing protein n=1 Tax=Piloderma croceum (strain F 1598) TaxID=765440 RepID=A0A0C3CND5_PILCF|nr:hypothetical protein PILCRDRAFT_1399 [Piloderma croceum F 1598]
MPSEETKERITKIVEVGRTHSYPNLPHLQTVLHYGWIPLIIYVGYTRSNPQPSLIKMISPLA